MKEFSKIMLIIGTVIGSGFASGKEIAVFFSRFGIFSYFFIPLAFLLFFLVFYFVMKSGKNGIKKLSSSKIFLSLSIFVSLIFTSSMLAGTFRTIRTGILPLDIIFCLIILASCIFVLKKGIGFLAKINSVLIPAAIIVLVCCLIKNAGCAQSLSGTGLGYGWLFAGLYVIMNVSTSCFVLAEIGSDLTKKQRLIISLFASLILSILLTFINFVLLSNQNSLLLGMPLLDLSSGIIKIMMQIVIFLSCLTSLYSLVYSVSRYLNAIKIKGGLNILITIFLPFLTSFLGFSSIVSTLYPLASVIGLLLVLPFIYQPKRKNASYL